MKNLAIILVLCLSSCNLNPQQRQALFGNNNYQTPRQYQTQQPPTIYQSVYPTYQYQSYPGTAYPLNLQPMNPAMIQTDSQLLNNIANMGR